MSEMKPKIKRRGIRLPARLEHESKLAIGETYGEIGSIRNCKSIFDFGAYRMVLVRNFDKQIRILKKKMPKGMTYREVMLKYFPKEMENERKERDRVIKKFVDSTLKELIEARM